ncbi:MAG TPA: mechanosensitive ion channel family protein, partial [Methanocorpusculum sp.]|nr:mechanosensitive ion channel family protein [Methanocorpusculum sp.]
FVRIPNESMFTSDITNYVSNIARRFDYTIGISYNDDIKKAISIIKDTVEKHPYVLENPAPFLYVDELADSSINITVRMWSPSGYWWDAKTELLWKIYDALTEGGVEIPFNQMVLWFGENDAEKLKEASLNKKQSGSGVAQILGESYSAPENAIKEEK